MGDHYIPRYYLKGFTGSSAEAIWVYDKEDARKYRTNVGNVAQESGYYSPSIETYLANEIESPANAVIGKIRDRQPITPEEKLVLSRYMIVLLKRVPQGKKRLQESAPKVVESLMERWNRRIDDLAAAHASDARLLESRRQQIRDVLEQFAHELPKEVWLDNLPPEQTPRAVDVVSVMTWRFLTYDDLPAFLTCDNPVFYFTWMGIGNPEGEVTFPVSSNVALWATWRTDLAEGYFPTSTQIVKELNRRTAGNATRFVFHASDEEWVLPFVLKPRRRLNRIL